MHSSHTSNQHETLSTLQRMIDRLNDWGLMALQHIKAILCLKN